MNKSNVYFVNLKAKGEGQNKINKIKRLFDAAGFEKFLTKDSLTAVKVHFGEIGNDTYISPVLIRPIIDKIKEKGAKPFVTDCNTIYKGSRGNAVDHIITAIQHGFTYSVVGAPIIIGDGLKSRNITEVQIDKKHFKKVKIGSDIEEADNLIVVSHFKGHMLAGFGGAIKNLAMGCGTALGKKEQHSLKIFAKDKCTACGACLTVCPVGAIKIANKATVDDSICIGCGECMRFCPVKALTFDWRTEVIPFTEKMTEYAYGAIKNKIGKVGFINFLINITPDCDCLPWSELPIVPDIGILASTDPVAIDKASYDLVNLQEGLKGSNLSTNLEPNKDKFKGLHPHTEGYVQITYGEEIGLGNINYNLIEVK